MDGHSSIHTPHAARYQYSLGRVAAAARFHPGLGIRVLGDLGFSNPRTCTCTLYY